MKNNGFIVAILVIALLSSLFGAGGTQPARAEAAMLDDVAGISLYAQVTPGVDFLAGAKAACASTPEIETTAYFICSVAVADYAAVYAPHVFVNSDGWIMAYYLKDEPAAKMIDVIAQPLDTLLTYPTLLEQAFGLVSVSAGITETLAITETTGITGTISASYYDFSNPLATDMLLVAEDKAEDEGLLGDDDAWFTIAMPEGEYYETSYGFYQNYYPSFTLDGANFVLTSADYIGPITDGTIYGALDTVFTPDESYLFEVDTMSLAPAGYGALLITYSNVVEEFVLDSADWVEEFELTAPPEELTDLFTFNFAPAEFVKMAPVNATTGVGVSVLLSWGESAGASYEYCVDETNDNDCDTGWVSTTATSATLSGLPYNATYYWQVRAVNSYTTTEADGGEWWSFSTIVGTPAAFGKLSPADKITGVATSPLLDWEDAEGAEYYEYCVVLSELNCENDDWVNTGLVSQAVVNLSLNEEYRWQVRAGNSKGLTEADGDVFWSFLTIADGFNKVSPIDGTVNVNPKETIEWNAMSGATSYQYCVDTTDNNSCNRWVSAGTATTATVKGLKYLTTYYWQVRAVTATGTIEANAGDWWTFTTRDRKAPPKPTVSFLKISPLDEAIDQPIKDLKLDWEDVTSAVSYEYCIDMKDDGACFEWKLISTSEVTIASLAYETTYYWQVRTLVDGVVTYADDSQTAYWSFTTIAEPVVPEPTEVP